MKFQTTFYIVEQQLRLSKFRTGYLWIG